MWPLMSTKLGAVDEPCPMLPAIASLRRANQWPPDIYEDGVGFKSTAVCRNIHQASG